MTFTEAAAQVLRLVGKPLHYKEITDVAIEKDLLSHVGKSPEVTMGARLAAIVKKGDKELPLVRVKPGVFALAEWDQETIDKGLSDRTPALKKIAQIAKQEKLKPADAVEQAESDAAQPVLEESAVNLPIPELDQPGEGMDDDEKARAELSAAAGEIFDAEDDDDEPIFGGPDAEEEGDSESDSGSKRRGRRRSRRGRSGDRDDDDLPSYTVSDASDDAVAVAAEDSKDDEGPERSRRGRGRGRGRERDKDRTRNGERETEQVEVADVLVDDAVGVTLADAAERLLEAFKRQGSASPKQLADAASRNSRGGDAQLAASIVASCRADNLRRGARHERARFRFAADGRISLVDWSLDRELLKLEKEAVAQIDKYQEVLRARLLRKLSDLPHRALSELLLLLLERLDYQQFKPVKRAGSHPSELHLSGVLKTASGEQSVAIVVRRDGRDIGRERVTDLRGSLHHYGSASVGLLVTTGSILSGAREESSAEGATPVHFLDGQRLVGLCEQYGVGVTRNYVSMAAPDTDFFDALRAGS